MYFDQMEAVEISPKSGVIMQTMSERIVEFGGAALIADYGYSRYEIPGLVANILAKDLTSFCRNFDKGGQSIRQNYWVLEFPGEILNPHCHLTCTGVVTDKAFVMI